MLDRDLHETARGAAARLAEAEREAVRARSEYHSAVRRLHLAGASLREIAEALAVSHQRVQQIVTGAGGSWWTRVWRTRTMTSNGMACTWCGRSSTEVSKLIAGPNVFVCDVCVERAERAGRGVAVSGLERASARTSRRCAFCRKRPSRERSLVIGPAADVCTECLRICREILAGQAA